jgi:hypothetical protein
VRVELRSVNACPVSFIKQLELKTDWNIRLLTDQPLTAQFGSCSASSHWKNGILTRRATNARYHSTNNLSIQMRQPPRTLVLKCNLLGYGRGGMDEIYHSQCECLFTIVTTNPNFSCRGYQNKRWLLTLHQPWMRRWRHQTTPELHVSGLKVSKEDGVVCSYFCLGPLNGDDNFWS